VRFGDLLTTRGFPHAISFPRRSHPRDHFGTSPSRVCASATFLLPSGSPTPFHFRVGPTLGIISERRLRACALRRPSYYPRVPPRLFISASGPPSGSFRNVAYARVRFADLLTTLGFPHAFSFPRRAHPRDHFGTSPPPVCASASLLLPYGSPPPFPFRHGH